MSDSHSAESVSGRDRMDRVQRLLDNHSKLQLASKFDSAESKLAEYQRRVGELAQENANLRARLRGEMAA